MVQKGELFVDDKVKEKYILKEGTMRKGRMLCSKEFNFAQKVWRLSTADNGLGWRLVIPERLTIGFRMGLWVIPYELTWKLRSTT